MEKRISFVALDTWHGISTCVFIVSIAAFHPEVHGSSNAAESSPRGVDIIPAGGCDSLGICDLSIGIPGDFLQACGDGSWHGLAWPHQTDGAVVYAINMLHLTNFGAGDLYLVGDGGGCPDVTDILWTGCCAISDQPTGVNVTYCTGPIATGSMTWVVAVPQTSFAFDVAFNSMNESPGQGYINVTGDGQCQDWLDLINFSTPNGGTYGGCYCVSLSTEPCTAGNYSCGDPPTCGAGQGDCCAAHSESGCENLACCLQVCAADPSCCETEWHDGCVETAFDLCPDQCVSPAYCDPPAPCNGDANVDGVVDPLDAGFVLARFGADVCLATNCSADVNCDGAIDPLDSGYVLARLGTCAPSTPCSDLCR